MKQILTFLALIAWTPFLFAAPEYKAVADWVKLPEGRPQLGNMHGDVAVSSAGEIYVSVQDAKAGLQVYGSDGKWIRNVKGAPNDFHGFVIHKDKGGELEQWLSDNHPYDEPQWIAIEADQASSSYAKWVFEETGAGNK